MVDAYLLAGILGIITHLTSNILNRFVRLIFQIIQCARLNAVARTFSWSVLTIEMNHITYFVALQKTNHWLIGLLSIPTMQFDAHRGFAEWHIMNINEILERFVSGRQLIDNEIYAVAA